MSKKNVPLAKIVCLVQEVMSWHRDKESYDYNECDITPCHWCEEAQKVIDELTNKEKKEEKK